ncbi:carboxymuconolactone decarboxylase family protein [Nocardioides sp. LHG3406-4]|uniref:carboxymuconolactone decarboxylase family protein n=1 Tax=Nocardioides sp. LHG3406-4 TaxID=2804575 RepID=UPI003CE7A8AC
MTTVNLGKQHAAAYQRLTDLSAEAATAMEKAGLSAGLTELIRIRVSQLNGCAFCLRMHTRDALAKGETPDRVAVLAAWWESQYFTDQERAALAVAERVNDIALTPRHPEDESALTDEQVSAVSWLAIVMGAWNRVAITSHYPVAP